MAIILLEAIIRDSALHCHGEFSLCLEGDWVLGRLVTKAHFLPGPGNRFSTSSYL